MVWYKQRYITILSRLALCLVHQCIFDIVFSLILKYDMFLFTVANPTCSIWYISLWLYTLLQSSRYIYLPIYLGRWWACQKPHGYGIAIDNSNNVYVADTFSNRIQKFTSTGIFITEFGSPGSGNGQFDTAHDLALDSSGNVYVADTGNHRIQVFALDP